MKEFYGEVLKWGQVEMLFFSPSLLCRSRLLSKLEPVLND